MVTPTYCIVSSYEGACQKLKQQHVCAVFCADCSYPESTERCRALFFGSRTLVVLQCEGLVSIRFVSSVKMPLMPSGEANGETALRLSLKYSVLSSAF